MNTSLKEKKLFATKESRKNLVKVLALLPVVIVYIYLVSLGFSDGWRIITLDPPLSTDEGALVVVGQLLIIVTVVIALSFAAGFTVYLVLTYSVVTIKAIVSKIMGWVNAGE